MINVNSYQPTSTVVQPSVETYSAKGHQSADLQGVAQVVTFKESKGKSDTAGRPELRPAVGTGTKENIGERSDVRQAMDLSKLLADLLAMILKLELNDSKMIVNSSKREVKLAEAQANALIKSGQVSMSTGISKGVAIGLATFAGAGLSLKGLNRHISSTRTNLTRSNELSNYSRTVGKSASPDVLQRFGTDASRQQSYHEVSSLKSSKLQAQGSAVQQVAGMASATIDGGNAAVNTSLQASRETMGADASVQSRQTDVDIKTRSRDEGVKEQTLATMKGIIQAQLDVMSHVAQNTRS